MAWIDRYRYSFKSRREGDFRVTIQKDEISAPLKLIEPSSIEHTITDWQTKVDKGFEPFMTSSTVIQLVDRVPVRGAGTDFEIAEFLATLEHPRHARIRIEAMPSQELKWVGFIMTDLPDQPEDFLSSLAIRAVDGLELLEKIDFWNATDDFYSGRQNVAGLIMKLLGKLAHPIGYEFACDWYAGGLAEGIPETTNPLSAVFVDQVLFRSVSQSIDWAELQERPFYENLAEGWITEWEDNRPIYIHGFPFAKGVRYKTDSSGVLQLVKEVPTDCKVVLEHLLRRFNLQVRLDDGRWRIFQPELMNRPQVRTWRYTSAGNLEGTQLIDPRITPVSEIDERGPARRSGTTGYTAAQVEYNHGPAQLLRDPNLVLTKDDGKTNIYPGKTPGGFFQDWTRNSSSSFFIWDHSVGDVAIDLAAASVIQLVNGVSGPPIFTTYIFAPALPPFGWIEALPPAVIDSANGAQLLFTLDLGYARWPDTPGGTWVMHENTRFYLPLRIIFRGSSGNDYYLKTIFGVDSWLPLLGADDTAWQAIHVYYPGINEWTDLYLLSPALPEDGKIEVRIGNLEYVRQGSGQSLGQGLEFGLIDNPRMRLLYANDQVNAAKRLTTNFRLRDNFNGLRVQPHFIGDGPTTANPGSLTFDVNGERITGDWKVGFYDTGDPDSGDSIDVLQSRVLLQQMGLPRRLHTGEYSEESPIITTTKVLYRGGQAYHPIELSKDWMKSATEGSWYRINQDSFTDDLDYEAIPAVRGGGSFGDASGRGLVFENFVQNIGGGHASRRVATTDEPINAGSSVYIPVADMTEALVDAGDHLVLIGPDLSFHNLTCRYDQLVNAGSIGIQEYNFPNSIGYPAAVFLTQEKVTTALRIGERGFVVSARGGPDFILDTNPGSGLTGYNTASGPFTQLGVLRSEMELPAQSDIVIRHQNPELPETRLFTTSAVRRGDSVINIVSASFDAELGDWIQVPGRQTSSEIIQTRNYIQLAISGTVSPEVTFGGAIGTLNNDYNGFFTSIQVQVYGSSLPVKLYEGGLVSINGRKIQVADASVSVTFIPRSLDDGGIIRRTVGGWRADGWKAGMHIKVKGTGSNNGTYHIEWISVDDKDLILRFRHFLNSEGPVTPTIYGFYEDQWEVTYAELTASTAPFTPPNYDAGAVTNPVTLNIRHPDTGGSVNLKHIKEFSEFFIAAMAPQNSITSLTLGLEGITVQANVFRSHNWDGEIDGIAAPFLNIPTGVITKSGTEGWCFTGKTGNASDADITGTLHAGGYDVGLGGSSVTIGATGIDLLLGSDEEASERTITWGSQLTTSPGARIVGYEDLLGNAVLKITVYGGASKDGDFFLVADAIELVSFGGNIGIGNAYITFGDIAAPAHAGAGFGRLYKKTGDGGLFWKPDAAGPEIDLTGGFGNIFLNNLDDVTITSPQHGQVLAYDGGLTQWVNKSGGGGGGSPAVITLESPTSSEDATIFKTDFAITVTKLTGVLRYSTGTPDITVTIRHDPDRNAVGNEVVTGGTLINSNTTGTEVTVFNDATIPAGSWVWLESTALNGAINELNVTINFTVD